MSGHFVMFVDIFFKNTSIDLDQNHSKCKTQHRNSCNEKHQGVMRIIFAKFEDFSRKTAEECLRIWA